MRPTDRNPYMSLFLTGSLLFLFDSFFVFSVHVRKSWWCSHRLETNGWRILLSDCTKTYFQQFNFKGRKDVLWFISGKFNKPIDQSLRRSSFEFKVFVLWYMTPFFWFIVTNFPKRLLVASPKPSKEFVVRWRQQSPKSKKLPWIWMQSAPTNVCSNRIIIIIIIIIIIFIQLQLGWNPVADVYNTYTANV